jgi:hypothetical protein
MTGYTMHAGAVLEPTPRGQQSNFRGVPGWFDFGASAAPTDHEGYLEVRTPGMRHVAARTCGRESTYKPAVRIASKRPLPRRALTPPVQVHNIAPRAKGWQPAPSSSSSAQQ